MTVVNEGAPVWRDLVTTAVPALVALLVVWLGGRQLRARQRDDAAAQELWWAEQRAFELKRIAMQERRKVYAEYLTKVDELMLQTTHVLASGHPDHPPDCGEDHSDARRTWMKTHQRFGWLTQEVMIVGSSRVYGLAHELNEIFNDLDLLGESPGAKAVDEWFFDGDEEPGPTFKRCQYLSNEILMNAREEVNPFPLDEDEDIAEAAALKAAETLGAVKH